MQASSKPCFSTCLLPQTPSQCKLASLTLAVLSLVAGVCHLHTDTKKPQNCAQATSSLIITAAGPSARTLFKCASLILVNVSLFSSAPARQAGEN